MEDKNKRVSRTHPAERVHKNFKLGRSHHVADDCDRVAVPLLARNSNLVGRQVEMTSGWCCCPFDFNFGFQSCSAHELEVEAEPVVYLPVTKIWEERRSGRRAPT